MAELLVGGPRPGSRVRDLSRLTTPLQVRLTPFFGRAYHPPDDDAPSAFGRQARLRAFRG